MEERTDMSKVTSLITLPSQMSMTQVKAFLDDRHDRYERSEFVVDDPLLIPRSFAQREDIEISAFFAATIAWGNRRSIINNAIDLMARMDGAPHAFVTGASDAEISRLEGFVHRTFNDTDLLFFVAALKNIYKRHGGLESVFSAAFRQDGRAATAITRFREVFFELGHPERTGKHIANPLKGSSAKRLNMFLRWMVRSNLRGVDFGIWTDISTASLDLPLDVHTGNVARRLGLLTRKQNDRKAVEDVMMVLRRFDPLDPVKYDFALFGVGIHEKP